MIIKVTSKCHSVKLLEKNMCISSFMHEKPLYSLSLIHQYGQKKDRAEIFEFKRI